jgi:hypothetical protein
LIFGFIDHAHPADPQLAGHTVMRDCLADQTSRG